MKKTVTLNPGESKPVAFSYTPSLAKGYTVNVDGLTGSFTAHPVPEAEFQVSNLLIEPTEVYIGDQVSISCVVTNIGDKAGTYEIVCEVV